MSAPESSSADHDRTSSLTCAAIVCLVVPTVVLLIYDITGDRVTRRLPFFWFGGSALVGAAIPLLFSAPYRALGFVTYGALGWLAAAAHGVFWHHWPGWAHGLPLGLIVGGLARGRRGPDRVEENYALIAAVIFGAAIAWGLVIAERPFTAAGYLVLVAAAGLVAIGILRLFRPLFELSLEPILWYRYAIRGRGPGLGNFPKTGPCLVIANHACWLDPLFLAKVLPRPITPMMTGRIFDVKAIRPLMVRFGVIRVPEKSFKKDAPEIREAIAALDRGECVVIFPEGYLRRTEERPIRRFGQGVWQVLQARPETPVFACWIEGGWGSYTSYVNGPPTVNKAKKDVRRPIGVGVSEAATVPADVLADHLPTRIHLMNLVAAARRHLDLPPLPTFELPAKEEAESD